MDEKLEILYNKCISELKLIGIDVTDKELFGEIDIKLLQGIQKGMDVANRKIQIKNIFIL